MGSATACAVAGRYLGTAALARLPDRRRVAAASYLAQACGAALLAVSGFESVPLLCLGVWCFGAGIGNATSLPPLIAQQDFASGDVARVVAAIVAMSQAAYAFAPLVFGAVQLLPGGPACCRCWPGAATGRRAAAMARPRLHRCRKDVRASRTWRVAASIAPARWAMPSGRHRAGRRGRMATRASGGGAVASCGSRVAP